MHRTGFLFVGALFTSPACQPGEKTGGSSDSTTDASTSAASGSDDTAATASCMIEIGPAEQPESDPAGCYAVTDEAGCLAKADLCVTNRGVPATCTANVDKQWCLAASEPVFLGCRPFTVCKDAELIVAREVEGEIEAFWSERCIPPGFGPATPSVPVDSSGPPPACEG